MKLNSGFMLFSSSEHSKYVVVFLSGKVHPFILKHRESLLTAGTAPCLAEIPLRYISLNAPLNCG